MSNIWGPSWSSNPYAPQISSWLYIQEKTNFAGFLIGAIFYGIVIVLFFQCMEALLSPAYSMRAGIRWGLIAHATAMFSVVTVFTAINLDIQSISYIDNREFSVNSGVFPPGPLGYQFFISAGAISVVPTVMFYLNTCLASGFLLHRCYVLYAMCYRVVALPFLLYLASFAMGIAFIYQIAGPKLLAIDCITPYYSISASLNVLLTSMILTRLVRNSGNVRNATGASARVGGLYKTAVTMLVESGALYAASYVLFIVPWATGSSAANIFFPILLEIQVIVPFIIILRVANRTALTSGAITSRNDDVIHFRSRGRSTSVGGAFQVEGAVSPTEVYGKSPGKFDHVDDRLGTS